MLSGLCCLLLLDFSLSFLLILCRFLKSNLLILALLIGSITIEVLYLLIHLLGHLPIEVIDLLSGLSSLGLLFLFSDRDFLGISISSLLESLGLLGLLVLHDFEHMLLRRFHSFDGIVRGTGEIMRDLDASGPSVEDGRIEGLFGLDGSFFGFGDFLLVLIGGDLFFFLSNGFEFLFLVHIFLEGCEIVLDGILFLLLRQLFGVPNLSHLFWVHS
jgi:hypothetical protein